MPNVRTPQKSAASATRRKERKNAIETAVNAGMQKTKMARNAAGNQDATAEIPPRNARNAGYSGQGHIAVVEAVATIAIPVQSSKPTPAMPAGI